MLCGTFVTDVFRPLAPHLRQRALDGAEDVGERYLATIAGQPVPAAASPLADDQASPSKIDEQVLDEFRRKLLRRRHRFSGQRPVCLRQRKERPGGVVDPGGDVPAVMVADG